MKIEGETPPAPVVLKLAPLQAPVKPVAARPSPLVLVGRATAQEIIALAGSADAEASEAIRTGMSVETFRDVLAARAIIEARRAARGR